MDDRELLGRYAQEQDQQAFAELVRRHGAWVYAAAKRQVRDAHAAEDVTQAVFLLLSRRARRLAGYGYLGGWLFRALSYCVKEAVRERVRRSKREEEAARMRGEMDRPEAGLEQIAPELEAAVGRLGRSDREAVLLRFYEQKPLVEVGRVLGVSEDTARKRVERVVGKLREKLVARGVAAKAEALSAVVLAHAGEGAMAGQVERVMQRMGGSGSTMAGEIAKGAARMMLATKVKLAAMVAGVVVLAAAGAAQIAVQGGDRAPATMPAQTGAAVDRAATKPVPAGPKAGLLALIAAAGKQDAAGVADCFYAERDEERLFVKTYAENIVAQERFARAMERRFGQDDRYSTMGAGNTVARLPLDQASERVTGDRGVVEVVLAANNTMSIPMRQIDGKWRIPVGEMWDTIRAAAAKQGGEIPPMEQVAQVAQQAQRTTPTYQRIADAVERGEYKSADAAMAALGSGIAGTGR